MLLRLLGDFVPQTPYRDFSPKPHWGTSVRRPLGLAPHHVNPRHCKVLLGTPMLSRTLVILSDAALYLHLVANDLHRYS